MRSCIWAGVGRAGRPHSCCRPCRHAAPARGGEAVCVCGGRGGGMCSRAACSSSGRRPLRLKQWPPPLCLPCSRPAPWAVTLRTPRSPVGSTSARPQWNMAYMCTCIVGVEAGGMARRLAVCAQASARPQRTPPAPAGAHRPGPHTMHGRQQRLQLVRAGGCAWRLRVHAWGGVHVFRGACACRGWRRVVRRRGQSAQTISDRLQRRTGHGKPRSATPPTCERLVRQPPVSKVGRQVLHIFCLRAATNGQVSPPADEQAHAVCRHSAPLAQPAAHLATPPPPSSC